jgi:hypothetical protein
MARLSLPRGDEREPVDGRDRTYSLSGSDTRALATVGAFRVVSPEDVSRDRPGRDVWRDEWRRLADAGLIRRETLTDRHGSRHLVVLTREGKALLDRHASPHADGRRQAFYAGLVKPRELRHDAQIYPMYRAEADRLEREGHRLSRVVLDYELRRDYQTFLNRKDRPEPPDLVADRQAFAAAHDLRVIDGHLELPDLRIEYETPDGRLAHRDLELVTEHYSRSQLAGKVRAGFTRYRVGRGSSGRGNGGGGVPFDPRHLERLT